MGAKRVRGKRGRVAGKKTSVFFALFCSQLQAEGMLKRNNCVYIQIVKHCLADELLPIIRDLSDMNETEFYSAKLYDDWRAYDGLVDFLFRFGYNCRQKMQKHIIKHSKNEFALGKNNINGIENIFASFHLQLQTKVAMQNID